ncbi:LydA holin phage, holin superfamily III [Gemmobacter aquatilis]|uniref:LydA holin phage, holin superfamily III n=1 Tax=Gemmobacter aquatilis TaxID=933059 RepID=A0A1H8NDJ0_9RHOB|nr:phage holin family protein [Gemmobacter aquatilis]SEO27647.1 LydA holin phage, holin superfamily III [Gemmobacter aquatilis]
MDTPPTSGLIDALRALWGAAATTLLAAVLGRLVYHSGEARAGRRPWIGWHLIWEVPTAVAMALVAESLAQYLGLSPQVTTGVVAVLSYLGPRGARDIVESTIGKAKR